MTNFIDNAVIDKARERLKSLFPSYFCGIGATYTGTIAADAPRPTKPVAPDYYTINIQKDGLALYNETFHNENELETILEYLTANRNAVALLVRIGKVQEERDSLQEELAAERRKNAHLVTRLGETREALIDAAALIERIHKTLSP